MVGFDQSKHSKCIGVGIPMSEKLVFGRSTGGDCYYHGAYGEYLEKRRMFLRSYQFSRKQSFTEKVTRSARRVRRFAWTRLRSARRLKRVVWSRLRTAFFYRRKRFFLTEPRPTPILIRHDNQSSDLVSAISDMRRESYYGFVTLLHILNDTDFFRSQEITFLMPNDEDISQADMTRESLETFILRHAIPAWLMINHMVRFPNKTLVPCSIPDRMFTITKSGGSGLFVNNARIVSPNICQNSRISCHGISNVITFNEDSFPKGRLSPKMLSSRINSSRH
ncbi:hypothetical protein Bca4012_041138 [Brassica carinata]